MRKISKQERAEILRGEEPKYVSPDHRNASTLFPGSKTSLKEHFFNSLAIKPNMSALEWAKSYRILSKESSANYGHFTPFPYQVEPLLKISDPKTKHLTILWGAQLGKSELINCAIGYFIHQDPSPIMMMLPTEDMAEDYSKRRLAPMIRDTPELFNLINARASNNTISIKNFKGGNLALVGSVTPSKLASKPIRVLLVDECDRCEITKEGHSIDLAQKRTMTFKNSKVIKVSTPTLNGTIS